MDKEKVSDALKELEIFFFDCEVNNKFDKQLTDYFQTIVKFLRREVLKDGQDK